MANGNTYPEIFPPGSRVVVRAGQGEGTDVEWNGYIGAVIGWHNCSWCEIRMDKRKRGWPNPTTIVGHNVRLINQQKAPETTRSELPQK